MAAYAALVSVMHIIDELEHHPCPPISLDKQQVESLTQNVTFLQEFLEGCNSPVSNSDEADPLEMRIADAVYAAEDAIESHIVDRVLQAGSEIQRNKMGVFNCFRGAKEPKLNGGKINSVDLYQGLQKVIEEMDLIKKKVMKIVAEKAVVQDHLQRYAGSSIGKKRTTTMVGNDDVLLEIMDRLTAGRLDRQVIPIVGMGGIGKTTLARNIYAHPLVKDRFDIYAWATISQQYNTREILCQVLSQVNKESKERLREMSEVKLGLAVYKYLSHRRFVIVLDDMWSIEAWDKIRDFFPDNNNSSRIVVTTRLLSLGSQLDNSYGIEMKFLDEVSSWNLFVEIVFGGESCPLELEKIGKKIVENCRGLPLSIVVLGGLLEKLECTRECWDSIRKNSNSVVNLENDEYCLKILKMSYNHLPAYLKPCFLYMGVFEEDSAIRVSTIIKLWVSEGFLKPISGKSLETIAIEYLKDLVARNLILVDELGSTGNVKYCKIHDLLRDLCLREAQKESFYHVVRNHSSPGTYRQRHVVFHRSTSKKKALEFSESMPHIRSYIGDNETVGLSPNLRLLRTLKAYDTDTYGRHKYCLRNMFQLVNLRYLAVGAHGHSRLPSSMNLLWNLQTLVVAHTREVIAPIEIWEMPQLRHVQFYKRGVHLPDPSSNNTVIMENLQTLTGVRNFKCGEEVIRRIPNVKKLGIKYYRDKGVGLHGDYYCLSNLECLHKLESLSCKGRQIGGYPQNLTFPHSLRKLSVHVLVFVWGEMLEKIGSLPLLQKLKLTGGVFKSGKWETVEGRFPNLKFLYLKHCFNLKYWTVESSHFPCLEHLRLIGVKNLKKIPTGIGEIPTLQSIVVVGCSKSAVKSAKKIVEEQEESYGGQEQLPFKVLVVLWKKSRALQSLANPNFQVILNY
ncbi:hypothetical protein C2S51_000478 [Perilla frutescens var. frutescens]|nr:hypothetical protein C2S51_000478 [Perilla frutescens var. frutescens]